MAFAMSELHQRAEDVVWRIPMTQLLLALRQKAFEKDSGAITLEDKEAIDRWPNIQ